MITRNFLWSLKALSREGDWLIPETLGVNVSSLSLESAFRGLQIRICCPRHYSNEWGRVVVGAKQVFVSRYDANGTILEKWQLTDTEVSNVRIESSKDGEYNDFLLFDLKGTFHRLG